MQRKLLENIGEDLDATGQLLIVYSAFVKYLSKNGNALKNGLKYGDALSPLLFNFAIVCAIRRVPVNQGGLKLNGTHQLLVYADGVNILGGGVHTIKKNAEALVVASKETGLEENADNSKYMVMSRDQSSGRSDNIKIDNNYHERVEEFKYLGTTLQIKILFRKKLSADRSQGMLNSIRCRMFCLPVCYPKI